jgi:hypothetical protein
MSTSPTAGNAVEPYEDDAEASRAIAQIQSVSVGDTRAERDERIFQSLPRLDSPAYVSLLKSASAAELPAHVLVRAHRSMEPTSDAARATLECLVRRHDQYGYLKPLYVAALGGIGRRFGDHHSGVAKRCDRGAGRPTNSPRRRRDVARVTSWNSSTMTRGNRAAYPARRPAWVSRM